MLGYTGTYKGKRISIMGGGMGMPHLSYSYELFNFYDVDNIIRIGTAGSLNEKLHLRDVVIGLGASTDSNYASQYNLPGTFAPIASYDLGARQNSIRKVEKHGNPRSGNGSSCTIHEDAPKASKNALLFYLQFQTVH